MGTRPVAPEYVKDLDFFTRGEICKMLNLKLQLAGDYKTLAGLLNISANDIDIISRKEDPANEVLKHWETKILEATIPRLRELLLDEKMERHDVADVLDKRRAADHSNILPQQETAGEGMCLNARILAQQFMAANPTCVRAIPYKDNKICLYMHTGGKGITADLRERAKKMLAGYTLDFVDLERRPLSKNVLLLPSNEKTKTKELSDVAKILDKNLIIFENRLNVTAVQPSYRIVNSQEINDVCVTVFVLGKGKIPIGEDDFSKVEQLHEELGERPFDIVEGYYIPTCLSFLSKAFPLHLGVGMGVKGQAEGTGTLGAFVVDDNGKRYVLSCEHVLHPDLPEIGSEIVQSSKEDYDKDIKLHEEKIDMTTNSLRIYNEKLKMCGEQQFQMWQARVKTSEQQLEKEKKELETFENNEENVPRKIATYSWGVQKNVKKPVGSTEREFWVDAAVAELVPEEAQEILREVEASYGFHRKFPIKGTVVTLAEFNKEAEKAEGEAIFMKSGRTTKHTEGGKLQSSNFNIVRPGEEMCFGKFTNIQFKTYCKKCASECRTSFEVIKHDGKKTTCGKCETSIEEKYELWGKNCFIIHKTKAAFSDEGDSGAVVYDDDGRAWGIIIGAFYGSISYVSVAISLDVALEALNEVSGKTLRLWCGEES